MATSLMVLKCPTCGADLKAENATDPIECVYCGNSIVPVSEASAPAHDSASPAFGGSVRIDGIKTSSSALAYLDQLFDEYDWEAFTYVQSLTVSEIDSLVNSLKVSSADDKKTWILCFKAISVPFMRKVDGCKTILEAMIEDHKQGLFEAYNHFDAYKRVTSMITDARDSVVASLEKYSSLAIKYGAEPDEAVSLNEETERIKNLTLPVLYEKIEDIPQIKQYNVEKNAEVIASLAAGGIDADAEYWKARSMIDSGNYVGALNILISLRGYSDSNELIEKLDRYFLIGDVLEIEGKLYCFKKAENSDTLSLYPTVDGVIGKSPIISDIQKIVGNHANLLYYIATGGKLKRYDLSSNQNERLTKETFDSGNIYYFKRQFFLLSSSHPAIWTIDLQSGNVRCIIEKVRSIDSLLAGKMIYRGEDSNGTVCLFVADLNAMTVTNLTFENINVHGVIGKYVVYSKASPNENNIDLYVRDITAPDGERLIEKNVYSFCDVMAGRIFYYVGSSRSRTLISITTEGTERREFPRLVHSLLFEQKGYLYFIRRAGYNSVLCKCRMDGSSFRVIASDVDRFIGIKNGYLYYVNSYSALMSVRMDGSNQQKLCDNVEKVLSNRDDKIVFISYDDSITVGYGEFSKNRPVKSIYVIDFANGGKRKLAYDVKEAEQYSENIVYYIAGTNHPSNETERSIVYRLNVETYVSEPLLAIDKIVTEPSSGGCLVPILIFIVICLILAIVFASATNLSEPLTDVPAEFTDSFPFLT